MRRPRNAAVTANPVLIGAVTVLVVVVAVYLAYNANNGLPFVPVRTVYVDLPDGSNLSKGDDVRQGGFRIGVVSAVQAAARTDGETVARATLKLDDKHGRLPVDSVVTVRSRGLLGSKYVDVRPGRATQTFADEATVPPRQTHVPVQFDEVAGMFDARTRAGIRQVLGGLGDGFAGRGQDLNTTFAALPALLPPLRRVMATLGDPSTRLPEFVRAIDRTVAVLAPVAGRQAHLFGVAATTFGAISHDPRALEATIAEGARTEREATPDLRAQRPFLRHATALAAPLERSARELDAALGDLDPAVVAGTRATLRTPAFAHRLQATFDAGIGLGRDPGTLPALTAIRGTVATAQPQLRYLGPFITVCNYFDFFWQLGSDIVSYRTPVGNALLTVSANAPNGTNAYGSQGAKAPSNGEGAPPGTIPGFFHGQPFGAAVNDDGTADCEQVQRGYPSRLASFAPPGQNIVLDSHTPGSQGPVYRNLDDLGQQHRALGTPRVPNGETFTRAPQGDAALPAEPEGGP